jgi:hypothetical protein
MTIVEKPTLRIEEIHRFTIDEYDEMTRPMSFGELFEQI